jgi:cytochrome c
MRCAALVCLLLALACATTGLAKAQEADTSTGERLFQQRCGACHQQTTARNGVGPHLQGVVGRAAGSVEGFNYSPALRNSGITWAPVSLDAFLAGPAAMVPGSRMVQRFNNADERRVIIEFLQSK